MPRMRKQSGKLNDSINMPVNRRLKQRVLKVAEAKGVSHTQLARTYVEQGIEADEKHVVASVN